MAKSKLERKGFIWITLTCHSLSLKKVRIGNGMNLEAGANAKTKGSFRLAHQSLLYYRTQYHQFKDGAAYNGLDLPHQS